MTATDYRLIDSTLRDGSHAISILAKVDLPAPEGEDRMINRPRRAIGSVAVMITPRFEPVRGSGRWPV